jgi:AraC-like DNA-binding protein
MERFSRRREPCTLYIVHGLAPLERRELAFVARIEGDVRLVYRPYHDLELHLEERRPAGLPTATIAILRRVGQRLGLDVAEEFLCCLVIGELRAAEKRVASALGIAPKTLSRRLKAAGVPKFDRLMATLRIAHAIYRMDVVGVDARDAAQSIGFKSRESFANFVSNHAGLTPQQMMAQGGFERVLAEIEGWVE